MALARRMLKTTFVLGTGDFGTQGQNQLAVSGLRTSLDVVYAGGNAMGTANMAIYGMTLSHMNELSTLGMVYTQKRRNSVTVEAGNDDDGYATVFQGTITNAWPDMQSMPDVPFRVTAATGMIDALAPSSPISVKGGSDAATLLSGLAVKMGLRFENNGVTAKLSNAYYPGSARSQAQAIVRDAGIEWNAGTNGVLAIWNPGQNRGGTVVLISKETGMVTAPIYTSNGIMVRTLFNPSLGLGTKIHVETILKLYPATGDFVVYGLNLSLDALVPRGRWFADVQAAPPGSGPFTP